MKKQSDGRYKTKVIVGKRADGSNITKYISGATKKELEERRQAVIAEYRDGVSHDAYTQAMDWVYRYFDVAIAPRQKPQTAADIRAQITRYIEPHLRDKQLRAVSYLDVQTVMNNTSEKGHTLVSNVQSVLKRCFGAAHAQGLIPRDPTASLVTRLPPRRGNRALSDDEILRLRENLANRATEPLMLSVLFYTGMRRGEMLGLKWGDVDFDASVIHVERDFDFKTRQLDSLKTANAKRDIPIVPALKEILAEHRGPADTFVVHAPSDARKPMCEATLKRRWAHVQALLGADVTTRTLRDTYATALYDAGVDVLTAARVMGHADPTTTLKIYTDLERSHRVQRGYGDIMTMYD